MGGKNTGALRVPFLLALWLIGLGLGVAMPGAVPEARAQAPDYTAASEVVRGFYQSLAAVMTPDPAAKSPPSAAFDRHFAHLRPAMNTAFNFPVMTRLAVGAAWAGLSPAVQQQLVDRFTDYSVANYTHNFQKLAGGTLVIGNSRSLADGRVIVETFLTPPGESPVAINYLMQAQEGARWQIVDVFLSGTISELANRRSEFRAVIGRDGAEGLLRQLEHKLQTLKSG